MAKAKKKLAIIGTAGNRGQAPFFDKEWTIWGTGGCTNASDVLRLDAVFELHPERQWKRPEVQAVLGKFSGDVYMQDHYDEIPNSVKYPLDEVKKIFQTEQMGDNLYVTNTVAFMLMLAYLEGYNHIECWGVWMEHETEYKHQRENCEYYAGWLAAKGIPVLFHGGEVLRCAFTYAYDEPVNWIRLMEDREGLKNAKTRLQQELAEKQRKVAMQDGAIQYVNDQLKKYGGY